VSIVKGVWVKKDASAGIARKCEIRACAVAHGVANCGACPEYDTCEKIQGFLAMVPQARVVLGG